MTTKMTHGLRSYDFEGRCFTWDPPAGLRYSAAAIDVEHEDTRVSTMLQERFQLPSSDFLKRWTATEAVAKVIDRPILAVLREQGLLDTEEGRWSQFGDVRYCTVLQMEHWMTLAIRITGDIAQLDRIAELGTITELVPSGETRTRDCSLKEG